MSDPMQHPLHAAKDAARCMARGAVLGHKASGSSANTEKQNAPMGSSAAGCPFMTMNEGPAEIMARVSGAMEGDKKDEPKYFTNNEAIPWPDSAHSKNVGGLPLVSDTFLLQKQQTFNRSKTLERMVHPAGSGAFGYFEATKDMSHLTKACIFKKPGKRTPIFLRFSTVTFGREFPDSARNPRGFAIKHYTEDGNYDMVGLNWPIFFCRDPIQGPDVIRSQQRNPANFLIDYDSLFDFLANVPESNHAGMMFFSNHGTPKGWWREHGYGCHTFKWVNDKGEFVYVKYHYICDGGQKQFTWPEAVRMCGEDPDYAKRDLWENIEKGEKPSWTMKVQIMKPNEADPDKLGFDPFDVTKVWPRKQFPMQEVGKLVLNKNPENFHRDVEQAAFSPGSMIPGIEDSPDMLLQFRMFFYRDAQYHRIGVNLHQVPVNCPFMARSYSSVNFDGPLRSDANVGHKPNYVPNSFVNKFRPDCAEAPYQVSDPVVSRQGHHWSEGKQTEYTQARELYERVMDDKARRDLHYNTAVVLKLVQYPIVQENYLAQCYCIKPEYAHAIYDLLPKKEFGFEKVKEKAKDAAERGKVKKFMPFAENHKLLGMKTKLPVYQEGGRAGY